MRCLRWLARNSLGVFLFVSALASVLALLVVFWIEDATDDSQDP